MGGSAYYRLFNGIGDDVPQVDFDEHVPLYKKLSAAIEEHLVMSCNSILVGGFAVALAQMSFPPGVGVSVDISSLPATITREDSVLFSETPGRFIVAVSPSNVSKFEEHFKHIPFAQIGRVRGDKQFVIKRNDKILINEHIEKLDAAWRGMHV